MKAILFITIFISTVFTCFSQSSTVDVAHTSLDHNDLTEFNFEIQEYLRYQEQVKDTLTLFFDDFKEEQSLKVYQNFNHKKAVTYTLSSKPGLPEEVTNKLEQKLLEIPSVYTKYTSSSFQYEIAINGGYENRGSFFSPVLEKPLEIEKKQFEQLTYETQFIALKKWCREIAIPILTEFAINNDSLNLITSYFRTVKTSYLNQSNASDKSLYWNTLEKAEDDKYLLPLLNTFMLISEGYIDYGKKCNEIIYSFIPKNSLVNYLVEALNWRLLLFRNKEKQKTLLLKNALNKNNDEIANQLSSELLAINPNNTEVIYLTSLDNDTIKIINPLTSFISKPKNAIEKYEYGLRKNLDELFIIPEEFEEDFQRFADIAFRLNDFYFASNIYHLILTRNEKENQLKYEYCLNELGIFKKISRSKKRKFKRINKQIKQEIENTSF